MESNTLSDLMPYRRNVTSQWGEDGIVEEIFNRIGTDHRVCVEVGAWDGHHLSNTWGLWHNKGWSAVLIEGEEDRFRTLKDRTKEFKSVKPLCAFVRPDGATCLDQILKALKVPADFDLLSIDIDGDDYFVFKSLRCFMPRVVIVEFNPTIPPELEVIQKPGEYFGCSAAALVTMARKLKYRLAACTDTNCIFVHDSCFAKLEMEEPDLSRIFPRRHLTYLITSPGGAAFVSAPPVFLDLNSIPASPLRRMIARVRHPKRSPHPQLEKKPNGLVSVTVAKCSNGISSERLGPHWIGKTVKSFLRDTLPYDWRLANRRRILVSRWEAGGRRIPPPPAVKQSIVSEYADRYRLKTLVETGTYAGEMVMNQRRRFERIYSIELNRTLYEQARARFARFPHIKLLHGDSGELLPHLIDNLPDGTLFWLDGHWSDGNTARGEKATPIVAELEAILKRPARSDVILIDDARCFTGEDDYPTIAEVREMICTRRPDLDFSIECDIMRAVPRGVSQH